VAGERLIACVLTSVSDEIGALAKGLSTLSTFVRFLSCNRKLICWRQADAEVHVGDKRLNLIGCYQKTPPGSY